MINQVNELLPLIIINNKEEWEVKDILDTRSYQSKLKYQVKQISWNKDKEWYDAIKFDNF